MDRAYSRLACKDLEDLLAWLYRTFEVWSFDKRIARNAFLRRARFRTNRQGNDVGIQLLCDGATSLEKSTAATCQEKALILLKKRINKLHLVKNLEIIYFFPDAYILDRNLELV